MATCDHCGRENGNAPMYYLMGPPPDQQGRCWVKHCDGPSERLSCERAAHARTRAELDEARDLLAAVASGVDVYEYASDPPGQWVVSDDRTGRFLGANGWVDEPEDAASFPTADAAFAALAAARKETP